MDLAPEFLNGIVVMSRKILSWAQSESEDLVRKLQSVSASNKSEYLENRISRFVAELRDKQKELVSMDHRIRRVYDQIKPSPANGITHIQISDEKFRALEIVTTLSKKLESMIFEWDSLLYAVENRHTSWEEAYAANSSKLTIQIPTGYIEKDIALDGFTIQEQHFIEQTNANYSTNLPSQVNLRAKDSGLSVNPIDFEKATMKSVARLGISRRQWAIIVVLGFGVVILYCTLCLLVFKILSL